MKKFILIYALGVIALALFVRIQNDIRDKPDTNENGSFPMLENLLSQLTGDEGRENGEENAGIGNDQGCVDVEDEDKAEKELVSPNTTVELAMVSDEMDEQILTRLAYTVSYNPETKCPNWVAWHLTKEHADGLISRKGVPYTSKDGNVFGIGSLPPENRKGDYILDDECVDSRPELLDWSNNEYGMSHGHMCPAADNRWSKTTMNQSFLLTNICPQTITLNNRGWNDLEKQCRHWAEEYGELFIACGPIFIKKPYRTIGEGKIAVPDAFFKVIVTLGEHPNAIGFIFQNDESEQSYTETACSVDEIEKMTGFDFFYDLEDSLEDKIECINNLNSW